MTTIGIIGAGHIGSQLARIAIAHGYDVVISNSRGPQTLGDLIAELGEHARAATSTDAAEAADIAVVAVPLKNIGSVPVEPLAGKIVIDANNYYPQRDGEISELEDESTTTSELVQDQLHQSRVIKAFNHIFAADITEHAQPAGTPGRRALIVAGEDAAAKRTVSELIDTFGFDVVDAGNLADSWRIQRDTPGYTTVLTAEQLRQALAAAKRYRDM